MKDQVKDQKLAEVIQEILDWNKRQPKRLNALLELRLWDCSREEGYIEYEFCSKEWFLNRYDGIHGGIISSIFDAGMGMGAAAISGKHISTADLQVSFLRPMKGNEYLLRSEYTHLGRRMVRATGKLIDRETGKLCATSSASFMITESKEEKGIQV